MAEAAKRNATYADLQAVPPHLVAELIDGSLVTHPRPAPPHAIAANSLADEVSSTFQKGRGGPGGWVFMTEPELHLGIQVVVPDIAGWRIERLSEVPDAAYLETQPDWVCEIVSPSTEQVDRGPKRRIYATAGVQYLWLLNPVSKVLEAFKLDGEEWRNITTVVDGEDVSVEPFEAISFPLDVLWPLPMAGENSTQ